MDFLDLPQPGIAAARDRHLDCRNLELLAERGDVDEIGARRGRDTEAALAFGYDKTSARQHRESLSNRRDARLIARGKHLQVKLGAWFEVGGENVAPEPRKHIGRGGHSRCSVEPAAFPLYGGGRPRQSF